MMYDRTASLGTTKDNSFCNASGLSQNESLNAVKSSSVEPCFQAFDDFVIDRIDNTCDFVLGERGKPSDIR